MLDRDGPSAFSMRRLAEELGVGVMTLYGYVRNRDEVLAGITARAFAAVQRSASDELGWVDRLRADAEDLYRFCKRHPHVVQLVLEQTSAAPGLFRLRERMLGTLHAAGFDQATALHALGVLTSYTLCFGRARGSTVPIELPERIRELPADAFPHLAAAADRYDLHLSDEAFEYGLGLILRGLQADLERPPGAR
jgi:AcrR family transcriptional regulator